LQVLMFIALILLGKKIGMSAIYYAFVGLAAGFAIYQQLLIRKREPAKCFKAFLNNNWLGAMIFLGIFANYLVSNYQVQG